jgi:hypothetical protein
MYLLIAPARLACLLTTPPPIGCPTAPTDWNLQTPPKTITTSGPFFPIPLQALRAYYFSPHLFLPRPQPLVVASLASSRQNEGRGMLTIMLQPVSPLQCIASLCSRYLFRVPLGVRSWAAGATPYYPLKLPSDLAMLILCYPDSSPPPGPGWYPAR